jgi:predicted permease
MRRVAGALFLLAFLPSLFFGIITAPPHQGSGAPLSSPANALAMIGGLVVLSVIAYGVLAIRKRLKRSPKDAWGEFVGLRSSGKRPVGTDPRTSHTGSLFDVDP